MRNRPRGQTITEYALIFAAVVIVLAAAMGPNWLGDNINAIFAQIHQAMSALH